MSDIAGLIAPPALLAAFGLIVFGELRWAWRRPAEDRTRSRP